MRLRRALLRLVPAAGGVGRAATCSSRHQAAACLAAAGQHSLVLQSQAYTWAALQPQPQRQFFSLPGSSPDLSKHYKERRLIG